MPTIDIIILPPKIKDVGLFLNATNMNAIIPTVATIMTAGSIFSTMLPGMTRGTSGGGSRWTSPPGWRGADSRGDRLNCKVLTGPGPLIRVGYFLPEPAYAQ